MYTYTDLEQGPVGGSVLFDKFRAVLGLRRAASVVVARQRVLTVVGARHEDRLLVVTRQRDRVAQAAVATVGVCARVGVSGRSTYSYDIVDLL